MESRRKTGSTAKRAKALIPIVGLAYGIVRVPQLAQTVVCKAEFVVGEGLVHVEGLLGGDADLELVFRSGISYNLKIVHPIEKRAIGCYGAEEVVRFVQESMSVVLTEADLF